MKPFLVLTVTLLSIGTILPSYAQCYYGDCESSSSQNKAQQTQLKLTDEGSLMVGLYTDPQHPAILNQTSLELSFEEKDSRTTIPNIDYKVSIAKNNDLMYETSVLHSQQGTATVQYKFKESGQYQVTVYVKGMDSKQIQESALFSIVVGSSSVPEFPTSAAIVLLFTLISIVMVSSRIKLRLSS